MQVAVAPHDNNRAKDVWSTVGGTIKPAFELVITAATDALPCVDLPPSVERIQHLVAPGRAARRQLTVRVRSDTAVLDVDLPGQRADIRLDVINTGEVIDGVTARVIGLPDRLVSSRSAGTAAVPGRRAAN